MIRSDKSDLPIPIKRNYPKLQNKDSNRLNENLMIKNGSVEVCENCYFMLNNVYNMTNSDLNGNFIKKWESSCQIERDLNFDQSNVSHCCKGLSKQRYGFKWEYYKQ